MIIVMCWTKMQRISWTDIRKNENVLKTIEGNRTFIDTLKIRR